MLLRFFKIILLFFSPFLFSQNGLENLLLAPKDENQNLFERYLKPALKGSIYLMNSGWYSTAKVHKKLGFDLTISLNSVVVPDGEKSFDISDFKLIESEVNKLPSIFGDSKNEELSVIIPKSEDRKSVV